MSLSGLLTQACTITDPAWDGTTVDEYGNPVTTPAVTDTVCELQQQRRDERTNTGTIATSTWLLILPSGTRPSPDAVITVDGDDYQVDGEIWPVRNPRTGSESHVECTVKRTSASRGEAPS